MERTIKVNGSAKLSVKPDIIVVFATVRTCDMEYAKAISDVNSKIEKLRKSLVKIGFEKDMLQTTDFNVQSRYDNEKTADGSYKRVFAGFNVTHSLKLEFAFDTDKLSQVVSVITNSKTETEFSIAFSIKDEQIYKKQVIAQAVKDATEKATIIAEAAGVQLKEIVAVNYDVADINIYSPTRYCANDGMARAVALSASHTDIVPEDVQIKDTVSVVWNIA